MLRRVLFAASVIFTVFSCDDDKLAEKNLYSGLVIRTGTICGWCSVNDTLTIQGNSVRYVNYTKCNNIKPAVEKNGQIPTLELDGLIAKLDFNELKKISLNSCNVCADGCDDWIYFENGTESHYIRFGKTDPKLQTIQTFIDQLNAIKSQYSKAQ